MSEVGDATERTTRTEYNKSDIVQNIEAMEGIIVISSLSLSFTS